MRMGRGGGGLKKSGSVISKKKLHRQTVFKLVYDTFAEIV